MISMTGFACKEWANENITVSVEVKGYNSRFLEVNVIIPSYLNNFELSVRQIIGSLCKRGKIDVFIRIKEKDAPVEVLINSNTAKAYFNAFSKLAIDLGLDEKPSLSLLINMDGVLEIEKKYQNELYWSLIEPVLTETLNIFIKDRIREGKETEKTVMEHLKMLESGLKNIENYAPNMENYIKENIKARFKEISLGEIDENRVLAETAILLMKYTISEELSRLSSHLAEFRKEADTSKQPGKKLDFLCQEINREINTIGSKSNIFEVSMSIVEMKEALENIREQLRNIE